jgi:hypothetical protein
MLPTFQQFINEAKSFKKDDIVQLKHVQYDRTKPAPFYRKYKPGDRFIILDRETNNLARRYIIKPLDDATDNKIYKVPSYHLQDTNTPLSYRPKVPKRLTGDIQCGNCGKTFNLELKGSKHRDHCPYCLCSVHIDIRPGDRDVWCGEGEEGSSEFKHAILRPIAINRNIINPKKNMPYILYKCDKCGKEKVNVQAFDDNQDVVDTLPQQNFKVKGYSINYK